MPFLTKELRGQETIGAYLTELLRVRRMDLAGLSALLRVQRKHLMALFSNDLGGLPGAYYARHLVKLVADELGGDVTYAEKLFTSLMDKEPVRELPTSAFEYTRVGSTSMLVSTRVVAALLLCVGFLLLVGFFGWNIRRALTPPDVVLLAPAQDQVLNERTVEVTGKTDPEVTVKVNGRTVGLDKSGVFHFPLYLNDGVNLIEIRAAKRYSSERIVYRRVIVTRTTSALSDSSTPPLAPN